MGTGGSSKRLVRKTDHLPQSTTGVKNAIDVYLHFAIRLQGVVLNHRGNSTFTLHNIKRITEQNGKLIISLYLITEINL
jgi:hypothetical protein